MVPPEEPRHSGGYHHPHRPAHAGCSDDRSAEDHHGIRVRAAAFTISRTTRWSFAIPPESALPSSRACSALISKGWGRDWRTWKRLDTTNSLARGMTPESLSLVQDRVRRLLTGSGVSLVPPNAVYFNDRQGLLMLRATEGEMKIVETAIQELNAGTRPWPEVPPEADAWPQVSTNTAREFVTGLNSQLTDGPAPDSPAFGRQPVRSLENGHRDPRVPGRPAPPDADRVRSQAGP